MKKIFLLAIVFSLAIIAPVQAADMTVIKDPMVSWTQDSASLPAVTFWEFCWSDAAEGPWVPAIPRIDKPTGNTGEGDIAFSGKYNIVLTGQIGKVYRKYFVIRAVHEDPTTKVLTHSEYSELAEVVDKDGNITNYLDIKVVPGKPFTLKVSFETVPATTEGKTDGTE